MTLVTTNVEFLRDVTPCSSSPALRMNSSLRIWRQQSPPHFGRELGHYEITNEINTRNKINYVFHSIRITQPK